MAGVEPGCTSEGPRGLSRVRGKDGGDVGIHHVRDQVSCVGARGAGGGGACREDGEATREGAGDQRVKDGGE